MVGLSISYAAGFCRRSKLDRIDASWYPPRNPIRLTRSILAWILQSNMSNLWNFIPDSHNVIESQQLTGVVHAIRRKNTIIADKIAANVCKKDDRVFWEK